MMEIILLIIAIISLFFSGYQTHLSKKAQIEEMDRNNDEKYDELKKDRQEQKLEKYFEDKSFDLLKLKKSNKEDYAHLLRWGARYLDFCFREWKSGKLQKTVPGYLWKEWDYSIRSAFKKPIYIQLWNEGGLRDLDYKGYFKFKEYIDRCIKDGE